VFNTVTSETSTQVASPGTFGRFYLQELINSGGMSDIWLATDSNHKPYALRRLQDIVWQGQGNRLWHIFSLSQRIFYQAITACERPASPSHSPSRPLCDSNRRTLSNHQAISGW